MGAECSECGHDLPYDLVCEYCLLRAENERLWKVVEAARKLLDGFAYINKPYKWGRVEYADVARLDEALDALTKREGEKPDA